MTNENDIPVEDNPSKQMLSNRLYDFLKITVQIGLPATSTLYFTLAAIWNLPYAEQVVGTLAAIATFLGVILGLSNKSYASSGARYDGMITSIVNEDNVRVYSMVLNEHPDTIPEKKELVFKVDAQ